MIEQSRGLLDWHEQRRRQGVPTISLLVGPERLGFDLWQAWCSATGRGCAVVSSVDGLLSAWMDQLQGRTDLLKLAVDWLATRQPSSTSARPNPARMTQYDLDEIWSTAAIKRVDPTTSVVYSILVSALSTAPPGATPDFHLGSDLDMLCGLAELIPEPTWPAVYLRQQSDSQATLSLLARLEPIVCQLPRLPVAVSVTGEEYEALQTMNIRSVSLAREGEVILRGISAKELAAQLQQAGVVPLPSPLVLDQLGAGGLTPEAADTYVQFVNEVRAAAATPTEDSIHRSAGERFLFMLLQMMPETYGKFLPNQKLEFLHGKTEAEADLLAEELRLVIEVDGAYYHLNLDQYRRDRRKDYAYQRHGYWVLRFLAEDVVENCETVLQTILEAVALRTGSDRSKEVNGG